MDDTKTSHAGANAAASTPLQLAGCFVARSCRLCLGLKITAAKNVEKNDRLKKAVMDEVQLHLRCTHLHAIQALCGMVPGSSLVLPSVRSEAKRR